MTVRRCGLIGGAAFLYFWFGVDGKLFEFGCLAIICVPCNFNIFCVIQNNYTPVSQSLGNPKIKILQTNVKRTRVGMAAIRHVPFQIINHLQAA